MRVMALVLVVFIASSACAAELGRVTGLPIPRFVSFKSKITNVRVGPSNQHPVKWVYHQKGYPIKVVAEFEHWRKINDIDGEDGWVHEAMLSGVRQVVILKNNLPGPLSVIQPAKELFLLRKPFVESQPSARIQLGATCLLKRCKVEWCEVRCASHKGWILKDNAWGISGADVNVIFK